MILPFPSSREWCTKPRVGTAISPYWSRGLAGAWVLNEWGSPQFANAATADQTNAGSFAAGSAAPTWVSGPAGPAIYCTGGSHQYASCGNLAALNGATQVSMFVCGSIEASSEHHAYARQLGASGGSGFGIYLSSTLNQVYWIIGGTTSSLTYGILSQTVIGEFSAGLSYDGSLSGSAKAAGYLYGSRITYDTVVGAIPASLPTDSSIAVLGTFDTTGASAVWQTGRTDIVLVWIDRVLTAAEQGLLAANPWRIFRRSSDLWSLAVAAAAANGPVYPIGRSTLQPRRPAASGPLFTRLYG